MAKPLRLSLIFACTLTAAVTTNAQTNYQPYAFTTLAGSAVPLGPGFSDGKGSAARFNGARGVAVDNTGNVYVADTSNHTIRKITPDAVVTTLAGLAGNPGTTNGTGNIARFNSPTSLAVDSSGTIYVADTGNQTIRKITPTGAVSSLAGLGGVAGLSTEPEIERGSIIPLA